MPTSTADILNSATEDMKKLLSTLKVSTGPNPVELMQKIADELDLLNKNLSPTLLEKGEIIIFTKDKPIRVKYRDLPQIFRRGGDTMLTLARAFVEGD